MGAWRQSDGTVRRTGDRFMTAWSSSLAPVGTHGKAHAGAQQQQQQPLPLALTTSSAAAANTIDTTNASDGRSGSHAAVCAASVTAVHAAAQAMMRSMSEGLSLDWRLTATTAIPAMPPSASTSVTSLHGAMPPPPRAATVLATIAPVAPSVPEATQARRKRLELQLDPSSIVDLAFL
jgi:hypothetical protein